MSHSRGNYLSSFGHVTEEHVAVALFFRVGAKELSASYKFVEFFVRHWRLVYPKVFDMLYPDGVLA